MRTALAGLLALFIAAPVAAAPSWTDHGNPFNLGGSVVSSEEAAAKNLGPKPAGPLITYSGVTYHVYPDGREVSLAMGGGHNAWGGNGLHEYDWATGTWTRLYGPDYFDATQKSIGNNGQINPWRYDYDCVTTVPAPFEWSPPANCIPRDGKADVPPSSHTYDGMECIDWYCLYSGYGSYNGSKGAISPAGNLWYVNLDPSNPGGVEWDNFRDQIDPGDVTVQKSWVNPNFPDRWFILGKNGVFTANPYTGVAEGPLEEASGSNSVGGSTRGRYAHAVFAPELDAAFMWDREDQGVRITVDALGEVVTLERLTLTVDSVPSNGYYPFKVGGGAWDWVPGCSCFLVTTGDARVWRIDQVGPLAWHASVYFENPAGPQPGDPALEKPTKFKTQDDLHCCRPDGSLTFIGNPDQGAYTFDPDFDGGGSPPPPDPVCEILVDGVLARTSPACDDSAPNLDAAKDVLDISSLGPSEGVVWVGDGFHNFTERNVKRVEVRADAQFAVVYGLTCKGVRGGNPPIACAPGKRAARFG